MNYSCKWALRLLPVLTLLFISTTIRAQSLKGKVTDYNGVALENVGIFNQTSGQHSHTNLSEFFNIIVRVCNNKITYKF